jgi:L-malate glycosyltransferase
MKAIVFFWENFGPMHIDRIEAAKRAFKDYRVVGVEFSVESTDYDWNHSQLDAERMTLFRKDENPDILKRITRIFRSFQKIGRGHYFLCHYDRKEILVVSWLLRLSGSTVITMACSKFDDMPRSVIREFLKRFFMLPYHGAIGSGRRSRDYLRFLGIKRDRISGEYNALSLERLRNDGVLDEHPVAEDHDKRHFTIVARLVRKKNIETALHAFAIYRANTVSTRELHISGSGPEEQRLRVVARELGISDFVVFHGFLQSDDVTMLLANTLALILPSWEEQFGNVVIEAQALGVPSIVSNNCGACDLLVRNWVNGFVIEPDSPDGIAQFMQMLCEERELWRQMASASFESAAGGDVARFVEAVSFHLRSLPNGTDR